MTCIIEGVSSNGRKIVVTATDKDVSRWIVNLDIEPAEFYHGNIAGNCFEASLILLMHITRHEEFERDQVRLCHGIADMLAGALGRGAHAWVEFLERGQWWVIDATVVGGPIRVATQKQFYKGNKIKADCVDYYLPSEIVRLADLHGEKLHCGPWREPRDMEHDEVFTCEFVL